MILKKLSISANRLRAPQRFVPWHTLAALAACATLVACAQPEAEAPVAEVPEPVVNATLNISLTGTPEGFVLVENEGDQLRFESADEAAPGELWYTIGEASDYGIEVNKEAMAQKELFEALPGGESFGGRQLMSHLGEAFYTRGRFDDDSGQRVEELRLLALHPFENRMMVIHYRYPAGEDSADRVPQTFEALGRVDNTKPGGVEAGLAETQDAASSES